MNTNMNMYYKKLEKYTYKTCHISLFPPPPSFAHVDLAKMVCTVKICKVQKIYQATM